MKMAKCVKNKRNGTIIRVSDDVAAKLVRESDFQYVPKSEWRTRILAEADAFESTKSRGSHA